MPPLTTWPHQRDAIAAVTSQLTRQPRATLIAATGTGKTHIAARIAHNLARNGRALALVPTLNLLGQTARAWQDSGRQGRVIGVCSTDEVTHHVGNTQVTTAPAELAALAIGNGPLSVFATYASLPVLVAAHHEHGLPAWDLAVVDEAHRTAGHRGKPWAAIHHDAQVPARRRLYQTATPRVWSVSDTDTPLAAMDDTTLFGEVAYRLGLAEAIKRGLLADYQVLVPAVSDADIHQALAAAPTRRDFSAEALRNAALQIAVLQAVREAGLNRVLTYHQRVSSARVFAEELERTAHAAGLLPADGPLWARWTSGKHSAQARTRMLREFSDHRGTAVISNARVFAEGVDIPQAKAVVFADARQSEIDTVQAIGRALRQQPGEGKKATIVVPVYLGPQQQDSETLLESSAYAPLWWTLRALRSHDDRFIDRVAMLPRGSERNRAQGAPDTPPVDWIRALGFHPQPVERLALAISLHVVSPKSTEWRRGYAAARRYHAEHGHLDAAQDYVDEQEFALGKWLSWQRHVKQARSLPEQRQAALDELGMVWRPRHEQWQRGYAHARAHARAHGHLAMAADYESDGFKLGAWLRNQRSRPDAVTPEHRAQLDALDPDWDAPWPLAWRRNYADARAFHKEHGHLRVPRTHKTADGRYLGEWLHVQRRLRHELTPEQVQRLDAVGMEWTQPSPHEAAWRAGLTAARAYLAEFGNLQVPQKYVARDGFRLGTWINNQRRRRDKLHPDRVKLLNALGMIW
ncbi:Helicase associated domain protein [Streptomyces sp. NPDC093097]|uniref:DEAD/DEAH box helicase n=1 Tax=Streptomyces sp. NPDC093097 TaxID=3366027 RepID=UPI0038253881